MYRCRSPSFSSPGQATCRVPLLFRSVLPTYSCGVKCFPGFRVSFLSLLSPLGPRRLRYRSYTVHANIHTLAVHGCVLKIRVFSRPVGRVIVSAEQDSM